MTNDSIRVHIETAIAGLSDWKIEELTFLARHYHQVVARGWGHQQAWFMCGPRMCRILGLSVHSRFSREEMIRMVGEALTARQDGLEALVRLTGAQPWAVGMLYVLSS